MNKKPMLPSDLAKQKVKRRAYNLYLNEKQMDEVHRLAHESEVAPSNVVDLAITFYLESIQTSGTDKKQR